MATSQAEFAAALDSLAKDVEAGLETIKTVAQPVDLSAELATVTQLQTDFNALVSALAPAPEPTPEPAPEEPPAQ